ncbi:fagellar hook-basal body protein [Yersinia pestis KIM D27]|nr:fagellar hook-basal body protein [Yersinia pestis KIM D27]
MDKLLYTAVSGANRSLSQQQIHANNLANSNTQGFRADLEKATATQVMGGGYSSRVAVLSQNAGVDMTPASLQETGRDLDIALKNQGLIAVLSGGREAYTRNGQMDVSAEGALTINGLPVLGDGGPIVLPPYSALSIADDGTIAIIPQRGGSKLQKRSSASNWWISPLTNSEKTTAVYWSVTVARRPVMKRCKW